MEGLDLIKGNSFLGNELWRYLVLFIVFFAFLLIAKIVRFVIQRKAEKISAQPGKELRGITIGLFASPSYLFFFSVGFHISMLMVTMTPAIRETTNTISRILFMLCFAYLMYNSVALVDYYIRRWAEKSNSQIDQMLAPMVQKSLRVTIVIIVGLFIVESLSGKPIGTLLAGLGVGGLAVALAAQETIKNFFGSLVIMSDKPFQIGERVKLGEYDGMIEAVGMRSTRLRTLEGHLITIPNSDVASRAVQNIGKRPFIRRVSNITITYDTPPEKVEKAVEIIREILDNHEGMHPDRPPRVYFNEFNDASLNIMMIYWYEPPDYWNFVAFSNKVNMEILRRFNAEGIDFAFPTQTVYVAGDVKRELALRILKAETQAN